MLLIFIFDLFQVTLHATGDIIFIYEFVPDLLTTDALYDNEPVAGLSDAFLIGDSELHVYHTLNVENSDIRTGAVVYFKAKPTCIRQTSCDDCSLLRQNSEFGWDDTIEFDISKRVKLIFFRIEKKYLQNL